MYHLIIWLSLIFGSLASMMAGNFVLDMFLFLVFSLNVTYNFTKQEGKIKNLKTTKNLYSDFKNGYRVYYSYNTAVGIETPNTYVSENVWSVTTARHLNRIEELTGSDREYRMRYEDFRNFCINNNVNKHYI